MIQHYTPGQTVYAYNSERTATVLGTDDYCIRLQWNDTLLIDRVLPECVESAAQHQQRTGTKQKRVQPVQATWEVAPRATQRWTSL